VPKLDHEGIAIAVQRELPSEGIARLDGGQLAEEMPFVCLLIHAVFSMMHKIKGNLAFYASSRKMQSFVRSLGSPPPLSTVSATLKVARCT
jgi:hypothetical protein